MKWCYKHRREYNDICRFCDEEFIPAFKGNIDMMKKKIVIKCCGDCPFCHQLPPSQFHRDINYSCKLVTKDIVIDQISDDAIHKNCPLENEK